jgi:Zn-finger nucleic acid-binding protein
MIVLELYGVEIDHCLECDGTWFDTGELELIIERAGGRGGRIGEAIHAVPSGESLSRRCPRCRRHLRSLPAGTLASASLDCCPRGHGLWVERGAMSLDREYWRAQKAPSPSF